MVSTHVLVRQTLWLTSASFRRRVVHHILLLRNIHVSVITRGSIVALAKQLFQDSTKNPTCGPWTPSGPISFSLSRCFRVGRSSLLLYSPSLRHSFYRFFGLFGIYFSLKYLSLSDAVVLTFLSPTTTAIAGFIFLHENLSRKEVFAGRQSLPGFYFPSLVK
jgi:EamA-like transporter family